MSSYGDIIYCGLFFETKGDEESDKVIEAFKLSDFTESLDLINDSPRIMIDWLEDIDEACAEEFYVWLKDDFGIKLQGCVLYESEGFVYRGEFVDGMFEWEDTNWIRTCSIHEIRRLKQIARESVYEPVELFCKACGKRNPVEARMYNLEYCHADVIKKLEHEKGEDPDVHIDWETADICGDFEYVCRFCGEPLACDCLEIEEKLKKEESGEGKED